MSAWVLLLMLVLEPVGLPRPWASVLVQGFGDRECGCRTAVPSGDLMSSESPHEEAFAAPPASPIRSRLPGVPLQLSWRFGF